MTKSKDKLRSIASSPISFPRWREVLHSEQLGAALTRSHESEIFAYLKYLKAMRRRASVESVLDYLHNLAEQGRPPEPARQALRWFFQAAAQQRGDDPGKPTPVSAKPVQMIEVEPADRGESPWEQRMVTVLRT